MQLLYKTSKGMLKAEASDIPMGFTVLALDIYEKSQKAGGDLMNAGITPSEMQQVLDLLIPYLMTTFSITREDVMQAGTVAAMSVFAQISGFATEQLPKNQVGATRPQPSPSAALSSDSSSPSAPATEQTPYQFGASLPGLC